MYLCCILGQEELLGMRCWCYSHTYYTTLYLPAFFHYSHPHKSLDLYRILDEQKEKRVEPVPGYINHFFFEHFATPSASWTFHFNSKNHENFHFYKLQGVQTSLEETKTNVLKIRNVCEWGFTSVILRFTSVILRFTSVILRFTSVIVSDSFLPASYLENRSSRTDKKKLPFRLCP